MAVKQDTPQKLLFANNDFPTIEYGRVCTRCKELKSSSEFYAVKGKGFASICKRCDNRKRQANIERARGPDWIDGNFKKNEERRAMAGQSRAKKRRLRREEKAAKRNEFGEWTTVIRNALRIAINDQQNYLKSGWQRKCETVLSGLRNRHKIGTGKGLTKCKTWLARCKAAKANLKAVSMRKNQEAWEKKCATCALNHKRKSKLRLSNQT